jgi:hypothetical protein
MTQAQRLGARDAPIATATLHLDECLTLAKNDTLSVPSHLQNERMFVPLLTKM